MSTAVDIAEAIVSALEAGSFSQEFTPALDFEPEKKHEELSSLVVTVTPLSLEVTNHSRGGSQHDFTTTVGIQKHLADIDSTPEIKTLLDLSEEVVSALSRLDITASVPGVAWLGLDNTVMYWQPGIRDERTFTSTINTLYRGVKS